VAAGVQRGLAVQLTEHFGLIASVTYIPLKTTSTVTIKAADGTVLAESKSELKADPIISYVGMTYKF
jgi:outer membrane protein